ncbi:hypothetical protein [Synechococcus sp. CS-1332]|uniref:hypothetical protein n=1 Tax=Synechococcus sp. CS-1332 TaxID=2847972 RepID=UPI00223B9ADC|nr:hypothetical protein [Synechococcus sp. CS-1332]MCT0207729.1 hypothetical protein [Synechococcus sp. CS-1332]
MAKRHEQTPAQVLGSFVTAVARIDGSASNAYAELLGLHQLMELLPGATAFGDHLLEPGS